MADAGQPEQEKLSIRDMLWQGRYEDVASIVNTQEEAFQVIECLNDSDLMTRKSAAHALVVIGIRHPDFVIPYLKRLLHYPNRSVLSNVIFVVGKLGTQMPKEIEPIIPDLIALIDEKHWNIKMSAISAIGDIGAADADIVLSAVPKLIDALSDTHNQVAVTAANALSKICPVDVDWTTETVDALHDLLRDGDPWVKVDALDTITRIADEHSEPVVKELDA
ncbi:MAG: HEAT repeat domain-containing protein, partial [Thermoplasmata archaeon]